MLDYTAIRFPEAPEDRPYVILNMVVSVDGKAVVDGTEQGLGSSTDRRLMRELRTHADVVLVGGGTLRATGASPLLGEPRLEALRLARGMPRYPLSAVLSRTGELPLKRIFFTASEFDAVVYLAATASTAARDAIRATGRRVVDVPPDDVVGATLRHMRYALDARLLLLEGGPSVNALFFAADVVDEFFLTLGPVVVAGEQLSAVTGPDPFPPEDLRRLSLVSCVADAETDEVFLRYRRTRA